MMNRMKVTCYFVLTFLLCAGPSIFAQSLAMPSHMNATRALFNVTDQDTSLAYAYPVPYLPAEGHKKITFAFLPGNGIIRIYAMSGQLVKQINFDGPVDGKVEWDVTNNAGENLGSDVYFYLIQSSENKTTGKILVLR